MPYFVTQSKTAIIDRINSGGVAIFPTDTVYGFGCKMSNRLGIDEIYRLKKRPENMSIAILVNSIESAVELGVFTEDQKKALAKFWPGALTLVVKAKTDVTVYGISRDNSVGLRYPGQKLVYEVISATGPLATTSLNIHGGKPASQVKEVMDFLDNTKFECKIDVPVILDGNLPGTPSAVVDIRSVTPKVIRSGAIDEQILIENFEKARGPCQFGSV